MDAVTAEIQRLDRQIEDEKEQATTLYEDNFWKKRTYENIRERLIVNRCCNKGRQTRTRKKTSQSLTSTQPKKICFEGSRK